MNTTLKTFSVLLLVLAVTSGLQAQSSPPVTTLSAALASGGSSTSLTVVSTTGISATNWNCLVDHELLKVSTISGSTGMTVQRAIRGNATAHASGSYVICGPTAGTFNVANGFTTGVFLNTPPTGTCPGNSNNQYLPVIVASSSTPLSWQMANCNNGRWVSQTLLDDVGPSITRFCMPAFPAGLGLLRSFGDAGAPINVGTNTTPTASRWLYGTIELPKTMLLTGASVLNGSVASTDTLIYALARADGKVVANTVTTGTTAANAGLFQDIAFTSTYIATGPARYWIAWQSSGTTTRVSTISVTPAGSTAGAGAWLGMLGSWVAGTTGTVPATFTPPTSLIDDASPVGCVY